MKKILLLIFFSANLFTYSIKPMEQLGSLAENTVFCYGTLLLNNVVHEFGHAVTLKLLLDIPSCIHISSNPLIASTEHLEPFPMFGTKTALMYAAGPAFGIALSLALLKLNSLIHNLVTNTDLPINERLKDSLNRSLFHHEQLRGVQLGCILAMLQHCSSLIPLKASSECYTDGYGILRALGYYKN